MKKEAKAEYSEQSFFGVRKNNQGKLSKNPSSDYFSGTQPNKLFNTNTLKLHEQLPMMKKNKSHRQLSL